MKCKQKLVSISGKFFFKKKTILYLLMLEIGFISAFLAGYLIDPMLLRSIWLVMTGTLVVLTGIFFYLMMTKFS